MRLLKSLITTLTPHYCCLCHHPSKKDYGLCQACQQDLPWLKQHCLSCSEKCLHQSDNICDSCRYIPRLFDREICALEYAPPINHWITKLKFSQQLHHANTLAHLLHQKICHYQYDIDFLVPVPLHKSRLKQRGFNQSGVIASILSKKMNIPVNYSYLTRNKNTLPQSTLKLRQRRKNLKQAFSATSLGLEQANIALIDDVITTGATRNAALTALRQSHTGEIEVWAVARA